MHKHTRSIVMTAMLAAVICVIAPFSIPIGTVPITLATFAIYCAAICGGPKRGTMAVVLYIILGIAGLPVFSNFSGGVGVISSVTGGYIIGYIPCAFASGFFGEKFRFRGKYAVAMIIGTFFCYLFGTVWFIIATKSTVAHACLVCVLPFLPLDTVKIVSAALISPILKKASDKALGQSAKA